MNAALVCFQATLAIENADMNDQSSPTPESMKEAFLKWERMQDEYETRLASLREDNLKIEKQYQHQLKEQQVLIADRESRLMDRQRRFEKDAAVREEEVRALESKLNLKLKSLDEEREKFSVGAKERLEKSSTEFVEEALDNLGNKEEAYQRTAKKWAGIGAFSLVVGAGFFVYISYASLGTIPSTVSWEFIVFSVAKGLVVLALLGAFAKYSYLLSNSFMGEAVKNADRIHAIKFGKFYLETFGATAEWEQVREAFENWNTLGSNGFAVQGKPEFNAGDFSAVVDLVDKIRGIQSGQS